MRVLRQGRRGHGHEQPPEQPQRPVIQRRSQREKCAPTPAQISTGVHRSCPVAANMAAPAPSSPNSRPTMTPYRRRAFGSAMTRNRPDDRLVTTTPATVSSTASPVPTASGTTSQEGAAACPQPNQTNAKKPSTATVTPRSRPVGKSPSCARSRHFTPVPAADLSQDPRRRRAGQHAGRRTGLSRAIIRFGMSQVGSCCGPFLVSLVPPAALLAPGEEARELGTGGGAGMNEVTGLRLNCGAVVDGLGILGAWELAGGRTEAYSWPRTCTTWRPVVPGRPPS